MPIKNLTDSGQTSFLSLPHKLSCFSSQQLHFAGVIWHGLLSLDSC
jgi:hypothetical protein